MAEEGFLLDADLLSRLIPVIEYVEQIQRSGGTLPRNVQRNDRPDIRVVLLEDLPEGGRAEATVTTFDDELDEWDDAGYTEHVREALGTPHDIPKGTVCWAVPKGRAGYCVTSAGCTEEEPY